MANYSTNTNTFILFATYRTEQGHFVYQFATYRGLTFTNSVMIEAISLKEAVRLMKKTIEG